MDSLSLPPTILEEVRDIAQAAGSVHRLLHHQTKKHLTEPFHPDLQALTGLLLRLTGVIHSLLLHLQVLSDESPQSNPASNTKLACLTRCADLLSDLQDQWQDDEASREADFPGAANLRRFHEDLLAILIRFDISLYSTTWEAAVGTLWCSLPSDQAPVEEDDEEDDHAFTVITNRAPPEAQPLIRSNWEYHHSNTKLQWLLEQRCEETGEWLLGIDVVKQWLRGQYRFVLLSGSAGCGKTFLTAALLKQLSEQFGTHTVPLCYYFANPHEANGLRDILQPLVLQILTQHPKAWQVYLNFLLAREIRLVQELRPQLSCLGDVKLLVPLIKTLLGLSNKAYIILDGLDGLIPEIASKLLEILLECKGLQILVLSRPLPHETWDRICQQLESKATEYAIHEIGSNLDDIKAYIKEAAAQTKYNASTPHITPEELETFVLKSSRNSPDSGVHFQLSKCRLWYLQNRDRLEKLHLELDQPKPPQYTHMEDFYKAVVELAKSDGSNLQLGTRSAADFPSTVAERYNTFKTALEWLLVITKLGSEMSSMACSKRAFFEGLSVALSPEAKSLDELKSSRELESQYCWLFDLFAHEIQVNFPADQVRGDHVDTMKSYRYCIHNRSFLEFAQRNICHLDSRKGESSLAIACLRFLNMPDHSVKRDKRQAQMSRLKHPFYDFAAAWWPFIGSGFLRQTKSLALELFKEYYNFLNWLNAYSRTHCGNNGRGRLQGLSSEDPTGNPGIFRKHVHTALNIAVSLGLSPLLAPLDSYIQQCRQLYPRLYASKQQAGSELLQIALVGPRVLMTDTVSSRALATVSTVAGPTSIDVRGTIAYVLNRNLDPEEEVQIPFLGAHALLFCAEIQDLKLLIKIAERFSGKTYGRGIIYTESFADTLERLDPGRFLDFQNGVCQYILDFDAALHAKEPNYQSDYEDDSDQEDTDEEDDNSEKDYRSSDRCTPKYLTRLAWRIGRKNKLECIRMDVDRRIDCEDWQFLALWSRAHEGYRVDWIRRLLQDPRRPINRSITHPTDLDPSFSKELGLQTPLHLLAEIPYPTRDIIWWIQALLDLGADVSAQDGRGRTPLHLVESPGVLEMLLRYGADIDCRAEDGRSVWHVAAYNHDVVILRALAKLDPNPLESLRAVTTIGRTPLAEAVWNYHGPKGVFESCMIILEICSHDALSFASDVPMIHMAARWVEEPLMFKELDKAGALCPGVIASDGSTAYHFLGPYASPEFVKTLTQSYGTDNDLLVRLDKRGLTAFECWIDFFCENARRLASIDDPIPIPNKKTRSCVIDLLLVPSVVQSKGTTGLTFWERFCRNSLHKLFSLSSLQHLRQFPVAYNEYVGDILKAILASGAMEFYEEHKSRCALYAFVENIVPLDDLFGEAQPKSMATDTLFRFIELILSKTKHTEDLETNHAMADILCSAAMHGYRTMAMSLLARGVGVDATGLRGESLRDKIGESQVPELLEYLRVLPS
ncbi:uncharacterized protein PgNI_01158 [Pyricularia grisea]|uniref:Nephrocystin 3-like N-terminal domain-containing protein n=1 Tax=Pyricularia grisea TaxID=148305 RepID=A0A6P8BJ80_PYRGI|nr:uncharacterized protein PgNI_01158 [Pyricularia grisea]TLD16637.1 hypothetical protein PgNI_01158 [Pyricularia grisea]